MPRVNPSSLRARLVTHLLPLALLAGLAGPLRADDLPPLRPTQPPHFSADVAVSVGGQGQTSVGVTISLRHSEVQWRKVPAGYAAAVEYTVVLRPRRGGRLYGDVWNRRAVVADYGATRAPAGIFTERRTMAAPPGRYRVEVSVRDVGAEQGSMAVGDLELPDVSRLPVGFSDLELGVVDSLGRFTPVPERRFGVEVARLAARVSLFDRRPGGWPRDYPLRFRVLDGQGEEVLSGSQSITLAHSADSVVVRPARSDLFLGDYQFQVELVEGRSRWRSERSFEVEESGPPRGREFVRLLEPLGYIAEVGEVERLRALPENEQARGWEEFWKRRDPSPETPRNEAMIEFFRRLRHADEHFQGYGPGWRSDMGRIYITYGPADQIESRPSDSTTGQIEIWYYHHPYRRYVFVDREGFGRFVLIGSGIE